MAGSEGTQRPEGYRWHKGTLRLLGGVRVSGGHLEGCQGYRGVGGPLGWQEDWEPDHIGPQSRVPSHPLVSLGVTYLAKAKQVTEMSSVGYYIHLELYLVTVCTFVSMLPNHIFLHTM